MKHTLFASSITAVCLLGSARAAEASYTTFFEISGGPSSISFSLDDVSGSVTTTDGVFYKRPQNGGYTWSNTAALEAMNEDLGLTLDTSVLQYIATPGGSTSQTTLTLDFTSSDYSEGDTVTIYLTVGSMNGTLSSVTLTGLDSCTISYAVGDGDGFSSEASFSEGAGSITLLKVTGTLTSDETVTATGDQTKTGFGFVALSASAVPEPATATLGLLALGALALRRRRA